MKAAHVLKYYSFLGKNTDAPFVVKAKVWKSALQSALFYGSETWLTGDLKAAETVYMATLKRLLGVRLTTCTDIVLVESGMSTATAEIRQKQQKFLHKLVTRDCYSGSYLEEVIQLSIIKKSPAGLVLKQLLDNSNTDYHTTCVSHLKIKIQSSDSSRRKTYLFLNRKEDGANDLYICNIFRVINTSSGIYI